ncbi:MAG: LysE/ArgO family amino acid transporter [Actinomycetota bacterium]|nr:LysE/ArgO family amino acid transporter [Actinomycetota bacterium]
MSTTTELLSAASGLGTGLSLIVAIGAQNAFVLRQGLRGEHVLAVIAVCAASDAALIAAGVHGTGAVLDRLPWVVPIVRWAGAAFLLAYGILAARRALHPNTTLGVDDTNERQELRAVLATCLALTWLNPHVYLDTVVLLGTVADTHAEQRWWFGAGAAAGSVLWFTALGTGARVLRPLFARPRAWQLLDAGIALIMTALAVSLLRH